MFINGQGQSDFIEDCMIFLNKIKELKFYIMEFDEIYAIKPKIYPLDYAVSGNHWQSIIIITHNKYIFSINNRIQKA